MKVKPKIKTSFVSIRVTDTLVVTCLLKILHFNVNTKIMQISNYRTYLGLEGKYIIL